MCYRLQDGSQRLETNGHVEKMCGEEEVAVGVAETRHEEVPHDVQEGLQAEVDVMSDTCVIGIHLE